MSEAMKKDIQEAFERALAGFEKRQEAEQQRVREREKFETEWTRVRMAVVVPAALSPKTGSFLARVFRGDSPAGRSGER